VRKARLLKVFHFFSPGHRRQSGASALTGHFCQSLELKTWYRNQTVQSHRKFTVGSVNVNIVTMVTIVMVTVTMVTELVINILQAYLQAYLRVL